MTDSDSDDLHALPPGQKRRPGLKVHHYGPVPRFRPETWNLTVNGETEDGGATVFDLAAFSELPRVQVTGDFHCASGWSVPDNVWEGVAARTILDLAPPSDRATHVMAWGEYGYSSTLRMEDFASPRAVLATHRNGDLLAPEHGHPLRLVVPHLYSWKGPKWLRMIEYLTEPRRGFWEERGYHVVGDVWREERFSYQE